uniref:HNH endonuclease n=1 Tax=Pithovirus LCPAC403 TaxID=2506596 RepID=A0A481ZAZ8_9VIRU|nr:MAG: HNH endonuclease [Pithovirus LCPAC403]
MKDFAVSGYMISSLGKVYSIGKSKYLTGTLTATGYTKVGITLDEDGQTRNKKIHTLQGIAFFGLRSLYGNDRSEISMDHLNREKNDNFTCCNLLPANRSKQNKNQSHKRPTGKIIVKVDEDNEILKQYKSIEFASGELKIGSKKLCRYIITGDLYEGYHYRLFGKEDIKDQVWKSTVKLYLYYQPSAEVSDSGWILRADGALTRGYDFGLYKSTSFLDVSKGKDHKVGRLMHDIVWSVFNDKLVPEGYQISHLNCIGKDNRLVNLELATQLENLMTTIHQGLKKTWYLC